MTHPTHPRQKIHTAPPRGATGSKDPFPGPAAAPRETDDEAAAIAPMPREAAGAPCQQSGNTPAHSPGGGDAHAVMGGSQGSLRSPMGRWRAASLLAAALAAFSVSMIVWE